MKTLNIWEVRAEAGKKEPHLDVAANVAADTFFDALITLQELVKEKVKANPMRYITGDGKEVLETTPDIQLHNYEILCVRLLQRVITLEPTPVEPLPCQESSPSATCIP